MKSPTLTDQDIQEIKNLYFAHYTPKEASKYFSLNGKGVTPAVITRYYSHFKQSSLERFDKSILIRLSPYNAAQ